MAAHGSRSPLSQTLRLERPCVAGAFQGLSDRGGRPPADGAAIRRAQSASGDVLPQIGRRFSHKSGDVLMLDADQNLSIFPNFRRTQPQQNQYLTAQRVTKCQNIKNRMSTFRSKKRFPRWLS